MLRASHGCGKCRGTGFKGRKAVGELLILDDALRELIVARHPSTGSLLEIYIDELDGMEIVK